MTSLPAIARRVAMRRPESAMAALPIPDAGTAISRVSLPGEHVVECAGIERLPAGGCRQQGRAGAIEVERALELIGAALGLSERQRDHELQAALSLRHDPRAMLVERARVFDAGGAAGPGRKARGRPDELQADIRRAEALDPPRECCSARRRARPARHRRAARRNVPPCRDPRKVRIAGCGKDPAEMPHRAHARGCL